jgi:transcriptional regulator with XRE-family HTH domain
MEDMELGKFLRTRREATSPADVGLPVGQRRRTPGLRRAEVATIAGISVDYLVRLEQGRDRNPSAQVLGALATALRLNDDDRAHLRNLAACNSSSELCPTSVSAADEMRPQVRHLLDRIEPSAAFVMNHLTDLLGWTTTYQRLVGPIGVLDPARPNLLRYTFLDERARTHYLDWSTTAHAQVANFLANWRPDDGGARALADELRAASPDFAGLWADRPVARRRTDVRRLRHPEVGEVRVTLEVLQLADDNGQRLVVFLPADDATAAALDTLAGVQPGNLRAVGG